MPQLFLPYWIPPYVLRTQIINMNTNFHYKKQAHVCLINISFLACPNVWLWKEKWTVHWTEKVRAQVSEQLHISVTKPIGTLQDDAVLFDSLFLPAVSVSFLCPGCNPEHCPWEGRDGGAGSSNSNQTACCCWREQVMLSLFSHWLKYGKIQEHHSSLVDANPWVLIWE